MKPSDFFDWVATNEPDGVMTLSPGPFRVSVGKQDRDAAKYLVAMRPKYDDKKLIDLEAAIFLGIIYRFGDLMLDDDIEDNDEARFELFKNALRDDRIEAYVSALWWIIFFASQAVDEEEE